MPRTCVVLTPAIATSMRLSTVRPRALPRQTALSRCRARRSWASAAAGTNVDIAHHDSPPILLRHSHRIPTQSCSPIHSDRQHVFVAASNAGRSEHSSLQPGTLKSSESSSNTPASPDEREPEHDPDEISDQEWEIRTGRAIYILQQTLSDFFQTGLITSLEIPTLRTPAKKNDSGESDVESIYSPRIRLAYTPPAALPPPFPRTLHVEGLPLYLASSAFVRHTLNALYTDLRVVLRRVRVHGPRTSQGPGSSPQGTDQSPAHKHRSIREKTLFVGLSVSGVARVSGAQGGWEVNSTYAFSPRTGLIYRHTIDSIEPAPHQAVFDALRSALGKLGLAGGGSTGGGSPGEPGPARAQGAQPEHCQPRSS